MKKIYCLLIALCAVIACGKEKDLRDDLQGDASFTGQVSYRDNLSGQGELKLMSGTKVFLSTDTTNRDNYSYYTTTDAQGNFTFKRLWEGGTYLIFVSDTIDNIHYSVYITQSAPATALKLIAENDTLWQNGMLFYVLNSEQEPLKGASVGIFNNSEIFHSDSSNTLAIEEKPTDKYGRVVFYNYKEGRYYLRARYVSPPGLIAADTTYEFSGHGISKDTILLKTALTVKNKVMIQVVDSSNKVVPGVKCCVFNNPLLFNTESCEGSYVEETSQPDGTIKLTNQRAGDYYIFAQITLNNIDYRAKVTATVREAGQTNIEMKLQRVIPNDLLIHTVDESGNPLPGISVCLFNNPLLFNVQTCTGSFHQEPAGTDGIARASGLSAGRYYLYAETTQRNETYKGSAFATIGVSGQTRLDLVLKKVLPDSQLEITVLDNAGTPVNGTALYFFISRKLWEADTTLGYIQHETTAPNGKVSIPNMYPGTYFIRARVELGGQVLMKGADSVTIISSPVKMTKTIRVQ